MQSAKKQEGNFLFAQAFAKDEHRKKMFFSLFL
jgi:hypothetical protein